MNFIEIYSVCGHCKGDGSYTEADPLPGTGTHEVACPDCNGTGHIVVHTLDATLLEDIINKLDDIKEKADEIMGKLNA